MWALVGLFVGAAAGNFIGHDWGAVLGGLAGFFVGAVVSGGRQRAAFRKPDGLGDAESAMRATEARAATPDVSLARRIAELEARVAELERARQAPDTGVATVTPAAHLAPVLPGADVAHRPAADRASPPAAVTSAPAVSAADSPVTDRLWTWFTGGNALTRVGVVVLFFGVAFLLRYFAEHFEVPIELKLAGVGLLGIALIGLGLRLAIPRPGYGLSLQGAGAGVLYLTTYAAFHPYGVLADAPAVGLLVSISALTVWLAVRSDSQPLAALAVAGGLIAPMLVAGGERPALLFGYFAIVNAAIFVLAWVRAWRALNALGFVFTFVLGIVWGHEYYRPEHYATVQPFLVLYFVSYVTIAILYAARGPLVAKKPVDGLLVFGVPLAGFVLQAALVRDTRYGAAWSAFALAVVYASLFLALRRRAGAGFDLLSRAFLALAAIFATVAVPLAVDERETAAIWAVEATGIYWIGLRQRAMAARGFALAIQLGAGIVLLASGVGDDGDRLFANAFFAGALLIALSAFATTYLADRPRTELSPGEHGLSPLVFAWGIGWWLGAGGVELFRQLPRDQAMHATLGWVVAGVAVALGLRRVLDWPRLAAIGIALLPTMAFVAFDDFERARTTLEVWGWLVFPLAWVVHWRVLRAAEALRFAAAAESGGVPGAAGFLRVVHAVSAVALVAQVAWEASEWVGRSTPGHTVWLACAAALPAVGYLAMIVPLRRRAAWPFADYGDAYALGAGFPIAGTLALWFLVVNVLSPGDASPLPYAPLANPLDVTLALALFALFSWAWRCSVISERARYAWLGGLLFVALNGIVLRTGHHWGEIAWRIPSLLASKPLQAALTLTWTATALPLMVVATRRQLRPLWMVGAGLLAVVVGKLFLVDLGALSGLPRVVAFLGVGALLLLIGWLSPLPPARSEPREPAA